MVEPLAAVLRNSLLPIRSALPGTSSNFVCAAKGMHNQYQPSYFSSNFFGPLPRRTKGKEKETDDSRLGRILQCKEWSCRSAKHAFCCSGRDMSFLLQELLPSQERPIRRFQNPRVQPTHRLGKHRHVHLRASPGARRQHASLATQSAKASTSAAPILKQRDAVQRIRKLAESPLDDFSLGTAWEAFEFASTDPGCRSSLEVEVLLEFSRKFCERVELFYDDNGKHEQLNEWSACFETLVSRLQELFPARLANVQHFQALHTLVARSQALRGQEEAAIENLGRIRAKLGDEVLDPDIAAAYDSICASIFYYKDTFHVIGFLSRHFFSEYFRPPYCFFFRDPAAATSIQTRHRRLLNILSTIPNPKQLFNDLIEQPPDLPTIATILVLAYCEHKLPQLALRCLDEMQQTDIPLGDLLKLRVVRALARGGFFDDAHRVYDTVPPEAPEYMYTGMHLFALQGDSKTVHQLYFSKESNQDHHNNKMMLLYSYAVQGQTANVNKTFKELYPHDEDGRYINATPDVMAYAIVIFAFARRSDPQGILRYLGRMTHDGIKPNLHIYSSMIQAHLQSGDLTAVSNVLDQMRKARVQPNAVVYTNLITALSKHHGPSTAEKLFRRALREGVKPDPPMVGALLDCYVEAGAWDEVVALFKSLQSNTKSPLHLTIEMYNMILKAYVLMNAPFRVVATLFEKLDRDETVSPTDITFILLLQSACDSGHMRAALDIFKEMDKRARRGQKQLINAYVFTILISGFLRQGKKAQALAIYEQMLARGIQPTSVTFNIVLNYYANDQSAELLRVAYEFFTRVKEQNEETSMMDESKLRHSPLQTVYEPVLRGYATAGNVEGFEKLLEEMLEAGGQLNIPVLTSLLGLYRAKGRLESAVKVWEHLLEIGQETLGATARITGDQEENTRLQLHVTHILCAPLSTYLDILSQEGQHEEVLRVWRDYQEKGFGFNFFNWNRLGTYLIRAGEYERAFEVLDRVVLPYIRLSLNQSSPEEKERDEVKLEKKIEDNFASPFDILNKFNLSFLQTSLGKRRPLRSFARSKLNQRHSVLDPDGEGTATMALSTLSPEEPSDSGSEAYPHHPSLASLPEFVRPLDLLARSRGNVPRPHYTLMQHLLIGYQRLRAGQPATPSVNPGSVEDYDHSDYTPEQRTKVRNQLEYIRKNFPDAVREVMEFRISEQERLGEDYERVYIWG